MRLAPLAIAAALAGNPAPAATLLVGDAYPTLKDAVRAAADGDTIKLPPGTRYDCMNSAGRALTLEGSGPDTVLTDSTCDGKAILVASGPSLTVRDLVLARARVPDGNGAGIRLDSGSLTVERVRFENDEAGVLASGAGPIRIVDCTFAGGGAAGDRPAYAVLAGPATPLLQIERTRFVGGKGGQVNSAAARTELSGLTIEAGAEPGAAIPVRATGGPLLLRDSLVALGAAGTPRNAAVLAAGAAVEVAGTRLQNASGRPATLLLNWTGTDPVLRGNLLQPGDREAATDGAWRDRASRLVHGAHDAARRWAGRAWHALRP